MMQKSPPKVFTGRHMAIILVTFFGIVIAVNLVMARFALSTFGGKVVENSYVASQHYNEWLHRAEQQDKLGWCKHVTLDDERHILVQMTAQQQPFTGVTATGTLIHPLGREDVRSIHFIPQADGALRSQETIAPGRWRLELTVQRQADSAKYVIDVQ